MKSLIILLFTFGFVACSFSQNYVMNSASNGSTINTCSGVVMDQGQGLTDY